MAERSYRWLFWGLAGAGVVLDQVCKYGVFAWLYADAMRHDLKGKYVVVNDLFQLEANFTTTPDPGGVRGLLRRWGGEMLPAVNQGALFGLGNQPGPYNTLFAIVSIVAAVGIVLYFSTRRELGRDWWLCIALGLILAGDLGNLYDRLVFDGVRDFLHFYHGNFDWPVFNIADCCLVVGAFLLLAQAFWVRPVKPAEPAAQAEKSQAMVSTK
jgi:lipoprotein signal peptidase